MQSSRFVVLGILATGGLVAACGGGTGGTSSSREEALLPPSHYHAPKTRHHVARHRPAKSKKHKEGAGVPAGVDPVAAEELKSFSGVDRQNWELGFQICGSEPEKQLAREYHTEQNWAAIGHAYGSEYKEPFNIAAEEGCMLAVKDSEAEWEAALEELPFKGL